MWAVLRCPFALCLEVLRAILDFNRKVGSSGAVKKAKLQAQMSKQQVMELLDVCCVYVYVEGEAERQYGSAVKDQLRDPWLKGSRCLDCACMRF